MVTKPDNIGIANAIIDANRYLTLGTSDRDGTPWLTPLYYTPDRYADFYWISSPDTAHSHNISRRAEVSIVVFDSQAVIGTAQAVYARATAEQVQDAELADAVQVAFTPRFPGVRSMTPDQLTAPARFRLYRARITRRWILDPETGSVDHRVEVPLS
ncbi:pyridoxamine 5'-phosphate oxidase family protein [Amycolatopsis sp. NPDC051045]|uniref:pyridoxamine 5'-phosphate oxidase family protein n=1 Tax=Amycolatopsis sp. NPDC051045 TaxID=3156922 RepID=UPI003432E9EA